MKRYLTLCTVLFYGLTSIGQDAKARRKAAVEQTLYSGSHFSLSLIPHLTQKAKTTRNTGTYAIGSSNMEGLEVGANYHINFSKSYSLLIGLHGGASGRNHRLFIPKEDYTPQLEHDVDDWGVMTRVFDFYLSAPVLVEKRWQHRGNNYWNLNAGVNVRYYPEDIGDESAYLQADVNGQMVKVFSLDATVGNELKPWLNYNLGGGYSWLLGNNNFLRLNLLANFSPVKMVRGGYQINVTGKEPTTGTYSANLSYLGLSVNYIFTGSNKRLRKLYEKELNYR